MAILAASIITRSGKAILSRQFRDLTKNRVTELLANFPALLTDNTTQHTTVEDEHVRYVYQPLDELYIILITNRQSNILQDIETLSLFAETVTSLLRVISENEIFEHAFEILSAMDEIVCLGYKENLSVLQIKTFLEMDSHEEKIQEIIERNKELEATEERKRRAKEIQRKEMERRSLNQFQSGYGQGGVSSFNSFAPTQDYSSPAPQSYAPTPVETATHKAKPAPRGRGLQLGKSKKSSFEPSTQPLITDLEPPRTAPEQLREQPLKQEATPLVDDSRPVNNGILVTLEEKVTAEITREGSIVSSELKGVLQLRINDPKLALAKILLETDAAAGLQFKTHPNVDKNLFSSSSVIGLKNPEKPFPSNDQNLGVLRWRGVGKADENRFVPIQFSAWLGENGDSTDVTLEYEIADSYQEAISSITILVPVYTDNVELKSDGAQISEISDEGLIFQLGSLSPGENGVLEFTIGASEDALFPIEVSFTSENPVNTLGSVKVLDVVRASDEESLPFDLISELSTEGYFIV